MELLTHTQREQLLQNGSEQRAAQEAGKELDFKPVVKLYTPVINATWLLTELDADNDTAFGLCDLGLGCPELGYVSLAELASVRGLQGPLVERDLQFAADKTLSAYAAEACQREYIVSGPQMKSPARLNVQGRRFPLLLYAFHKPPRKPTAQEAITAAIAPTP